MRKGNFNIGIAFYTFIISVLVITSIIYMPALDSGFFLDDFPNLSRLAEIDQYGYGYYLFDGASSTLGRPLSLFSFSLQHTAWPDNPYVFKLVNLFIHLMNGVLISLICSFIANYLNLSLKEKCFLIFSVTCLWILHPIQLTTTLYVVQRMTELSAFFTLLGILYYLYERRNLSLSKTWYVYLRSGLILTILTVLAILSKENGILLPLFVLICEITLFQSEKRNGLWYMWSLIILVTPLLLLAGYLFLNLDSTINSYKNFRDYSMYERLLTQNEILVSYLNHIALPRPSAFTLYHDDYPISTQISGNTSLVFSMILIICLLIAGIYWIKRSPLFSLGIFWFFGGHLLESTFLNLELYFEHRNYLPSFGIILIIIWMTILISRKISKAQFILIPMFVYQILVITVTVIEVKLWSDPRQQAIEWVRVHPDSKRSLSNLGTQYLRSREYDEAFRVYENMSQKFPDDVFPELKKIAILGCISGREIDATRWDYVTNKAKNIPYKNNNSVLAEIHLIVDVMGSDDCEAIDKNRFIELIMALAENPELYRWKADLYDELSILAYSMSEIHDALIYINKSLDISGTILRKLFKLQLLITLERYSQAEKLYNNIKSKLESDYKKGLSFSYRLGQFESILDSKKVYNE